MHKNIFLLFSTNCLRNVCF